MLGLLLACSTPDHTLVAWAPDPVTLERDAALLRGEAARAPFPLTAPEPKPDIVVIVLDTVRADHLGMYGYAGGTTPALDRYAEGARVYTRVMADAPWTLPSHVSLFTGRWPTAHGAHGEKVGEKVSFAAPLAEGTETVARALRRAGYRTAGIAANQAFLDARWGVAQGFDLWLCDTLPSDRRGTPYPTADRITALGKAWLARPSESPRFLFLNYLDAHAPWIPREGYVADPSRIDRRVMPYKGEAWTEASDDLLARDGVDDRVVASWREGYDAELRFLDEHVGALLDQLPRFGVGPEDYVFVLSDHGESLGENDLVLHSRDVVEAAVHVPLLVRGPTYAPGRDATPLQHHDVATMILAAAGLPPLAGSTPTGEVQVSELHYARSRDVTEPRYRARFDRVRRAFRAGDWKLFVGSDGSRELYDLATDPGETRPSDDAAALARLQALAAAWEAATPAAAVVPSAGGDLEKLQALGYLQ